MRITAHLFCLAATLVAAPAFAQVGKGSDVPATPQSLASQPASKGVDASQPSPQLNLGLDINKSTERPALSLAPIEKDQLELLWKPGGKWGITLDLTSRADNQLLPREELAAGLSYQVTPRFRFGGGVTLKGDSLTESLGKPGGTFKDFKDEGGEAAVRLESAFSF
jgi:hypothetical protein